MQVYIGTSGYSYDDWRGYFYPLKTNKNKMLEYYAREFSFTEINSSYYRLPAPQFFKQLAQRTPPHFIFTVKAYKSLTHERTGNIQEDVNLLLSALEPLVVAQKLGAVLLQFPYSFHNQEKNKSYLIELRGVFKEIPIAIEFRHNSWIKKSTWQFLQKLDFCYVCVDEPELKGLIGREVVRTAQIAYVRFHGRNMARWWNHQEAYERYDYLYSQQELLEWIPDIKSLSTGAKQVFIAFNNHYRGQAVQNARMLKELLT